MRTINTISSPLRKLLHKSSLTLFLALVGCTSGFDDVNTDRHRLTEDDLERDYQNVGAFFTQMQSRVILFDDGSGNCLSSDYQVAQGLRPILSLAMSG